MSGLWRTSVATLVLFAVFIVANSVTAKDDALPQNLLNTIVEASHAASQAEVDESTLFFERRSASMRLSASVISALAEYPRHVTLILRTANATAPSHRYYIAKAVGHAFPGYRQLALSEASSFQQSQQLVRSISIKPIPKTQSKAAYASQAQHVSGSGSILRDNFALAAFVIGGGGHDVGAFGRRKESGKDINLELRFLPFNGWFWKLLNSPEPHIGGHFNTQGNTNQAYLGSTWMFDIGWDFFAGGGLGVAIHDGKTDTNLLDRKELGLAVLFRESLEFGYSINKHHRISLYLDHISNAGIDNNNEGLDTFGLRYTSRI